MKSARLFVFVAVVVGLFVAFTVLPVGSYLERFFAFVQDLGWVGYLLYIGAYIVATVIMVPGLIPTLGAGFIFGLVWGTLVVMAGSVIGALLAFLISRFIARDYFAQRAAKNARFNAIQQAVAGEGFKIVLLTRLSPIFPFNLLNYLFGVTSVSTAAYFFASWIGMFPGTVMYVYFGTTIKNLADLAAGRFEGGIAQKIALAVGLVVTVIVTVYVTRIARRAIAQYVPAEGPGPAAGPTPGTSPSEEA